MFVFPPSSSPPWFFPPNGLVSLVLVLLQETSAQLLHSDSGGDPVPPLFVSSQSENSALDWGNVRRKAPFVWGSSLMFFLVFVLDIEFWWIWYWFVLLSILGISCKTLLWCFKNIFSPRVKLHRWRPQAPWAHRGVPGRGSSSSAALDLSDSRGIDEAVASLGFSGLFSGF